MAYKELFRKGARQQAMADALAGQAMTPIQRPQGRIAANTGAADALTQVMTALASRRTNRKAGATLAQAEEEKRKAQAAALAGMNNPPNLVETQAAQSPFARAQAGVEAEVDPNIIAAYMQQKTGTGKSPFGVVNPSDFTPESLAKFNETKNWGDLVPSNNMYGRYNPRDYTTDSWARFMQSNNPGMLVRTAPSQIKDTSGGGMIAVNPLDPTNPQTIIADESGTQAAADRARATSTATAEGEAFGKAQGAILARAKNAQGVQEILDIAEPLIDEATGSGSGAIRDSLGAFFGVSTEGAQATAQLMPLQAALMMAMPRMEGPQSDRDVILYQKAAGDIGNPEIPRDTKKAAIRTIRELHSKYAARVPGSSPQGTQPPTRTTLAVGTVEDGYEYVGGDPANQASWKKL